MPVRKPRPAGAPRRPVRNVSPDRPDLRDRPYQPPVRVVPPPAFRAATTLPVLHQGDTSACTGFALATVVRHLLLQSGRGTEADVSPWMLYSMARRYDEFPGAQDAGSSLRGALRGWHKHGACARRLWDAPEMPPAAGDADGDWWLDAVRRPLGAYYRVDVRAITDMHVALNEVGILYASALCHGGWLEDRKAAARGGWTIPLRRTKASDGGHAFAIVGYDARGFLVHNSWGEGWGDGGFAWLAYEDWLGNAMDCWVAQLGVVTDEHRRVASALTPAGGGRATFLAADRLLARHQLAPYVIDMENNGELSRSGAFRTGEDDVRALVTTYLDAARRDWGVKDGQPLDVCLYAHGGLTGEGDAAQTFARWWPKLYAAKRFPVLLMWESDLASTIASRLQDAVKGAPRPAAGPLEAMGRWWDERLESLLAPAGSALWAEMKQNAQAITVGAASGGQVLFRHLLSSDVARRHSIRLHLVGHSAGAIVHAYLIDRFAAQEWDFESVTFLAPALRADAFAERVRPWLAAGRIRRLRLFHLTDAAERQDPTCRPMLGYGKSLLYLVSRAFEGGRDVPVLGMARHIPADLHRTRRVRLFAAPGTATASTTHGGFDDDAATMASVIAGMGQ